VLTLATAGVHSPITLNKDDPDRLLAKGVPGGDIKQLPWPLSFRTKAVSLPIVLSAPPWVSCAVLGLCVLIPLALLATRLGFRTFVRLAQEAMARSHYR
jgi:hypothetical protein